MRVYNSSTAAGHQRRERSDVAGKASNALPEEADTNTNANETLNTAQPDAFSLSELAASAGAPAGETANPAEAGPMPDNSPAEEGEPQEGQEEQALLPGSGISPYNCESGDLLGSIDRLASQGSFYWSNSTGLYRAAEAAGGSTQAPTVSLGFIDGAYYPLNSTVLENDPYGMLLNITLSTTPAGGDTLVLGIGGTAVMAPQGAAPTAAHTYAHWSDWMLETPLGDIPASECISEVSPGVLSIALPGGISSFNIRVALYDNGITDGDRTFTYTVLETGGYVLTEGVTSTITIIDESALQHYRPDLPTPEAGQALPPEYGVSAPHPIALLEVSDGAGGWADAASLAENAGSLQYRFRLVDQTDASPFSLQEDVRVSIKVTRGNGLLLEGNGQDFDLADMLAQFQAASGFKNVAYNPASGLLTFTIDKNCPDPTVTFTGQALPDAAIEGTEKLRLDIVDIQGNEALRGGGVSTELLDVPVVSVSVTAREICESEGASLPNQTDFVFSFSSAALAGFDLKLAWDYDQGKITNQDIEYRLGDSGPWLSGPLPDTLAVSPGDTALRIQVRAVDDALSESLEILTVTIKPQNWDGSAGSGQLGDDYHLASLSSGSSKPLADSASVKIHDDTDPQYGQNGALLDGPVVIVTPVSGGQPILDADGEYRSSFDLTEKAGDVEYHILLTDPGDGTAYAALEDITVTLKITPRNPESLIDCLGSSAYPTADNGYDFCFYGLDSFDSWRLNNDGSITIILTVPGGAEYVSLRGKLFSDSIDGEEGEGVKIEVVSAQGNEAVAGSELVTNFFDVPVISIAPLADHVSESSTNGAKAGLGFTLSLSAAFDAPTKVLIQLGKPGDSADYGDDYGRGSLEDASGVLADCVWVLVPAGVTEHTFYLPIVDDARSEDNETLTLTVLPPDGSASQGSDHYRPSAALTEREATTSIVDDTREWVYTDAKHPDHGKLEGPAVVLSATDAASGGTAVTEVMENGGQVFYHLKLVNPANQSQAYSGERQEITVQLRLTGSNGLELDGADRDLDFTLVAPDTATYFHFDKNTGLLTLKIPAQDSGSLNVSELVFKATARADANPEAVKQQDGSYVQEAVGLEIVSVSGNEAVKGSAASVSTTVIDVPTVAVALDHTEIFESAPNSVGPGSTPMPSEATFTFSLSSPVPGATTVQLDWSTGLGFATPGSDFTVQVNGLPYSGLPGSITFPAGTTEVAVKVTAVDDKLSEKLEAVQVEIKPEDWDGSSGTARINDNYHIASGAGASARLDILDDTSQGAENNPYLDGPMALLVYCDENGDTLYKKPDGSLTTAPGPGDTLLTAASVLEQSTDSVHFKVALFAQDGVTPFTADEDITVTIDVYGYGQVIFGDSGKDFGFDTSSPNVAYAQHSTDADKGTLTVTVPQGSKGTAFSGKTVPDTAKEGNEAFDLEIKKVEGNEAAVGAQKTLQTTIVDVPTVSLGANIGQYSESEAEFTFTVYLSSASTEDTEVSLSWISGSGYATPGVDYDITGLGTVTIPAGQTEWTFRAPINDNAITHAADKIIKVELNYASGGGNSPDQAYHIDDAKKSASGTLVDDTAAWPGGSGKEEPAEHGSLDGPLLKLLLTTADGTPLSDSAAAEIMENGGPVYYTLKLVTRGNESMAYTSEQEITVTLDVSGSSSNVVFDGALTDWLFANHNAGSLSYDSNSGKLTVKIPAGVSQATFKGTPTPDSRPEAEYDAQGDTYTYESVGLAIAGVSGNEAGVSASDTSTTVTMRDVPTASITGARKYYSESPDPDDPNAPTQMSFTVSLTSPSLEAITIDLDWSGTATKGQDYSAYPLQITIPAGRTEYSFSVPITDDAISENDETVIVRLKPQSNPGAADDGFHVSAGQGSATAVIVDDTNPWPADAAADNQAPPWHGSGQALEHARLDGPVAVIYAKDGNYNVAGDARHDEKAAAGDVRYNGDERTAIALEKVDGDNAITYRVELRERGSSGEASDTTATCGGDATFTLVIGPKDNPAGTQYQSTYDEDYKLSITGLEQQKTDGIIKDYDYDLVDGVLTLVVTLNNGQSGFDLPMIINTDYLSEVGREIHDLANDEIIKIEDEAFVITITEVEGNEIAPDRVGGAHTIETIIDEDHVGLFVSIDEFDQQVVLEGEIAEFTVRLSDVANEDVIVVLRPTGGASGSSNHPAGLGDFEAESLTVTIKKGFTEATVKVQTKNDTFWEDLEDFTMEIIYVSGGEAQINPEKYYTTCTIKDDMNGPVVGLALADGSDGAFYESYLEKYSGGGAEQYRQVNGWASFCLTLSARAGYPGNFEPSEKMVVTLKLVPGEADLADFDWSDAYFAINDAGAVPPITEYKVYPDGRVEITIPPGYTGVNGDGKINFSFRINDDEYSESVQDFSLEVVKVQGSEGTIAKDGGHSVSGRIVDDPDLVEDLGLDADLANKLLDGPYVTLMGTQYISESASADYGRDATYRLELHNPDGSLYTALEDVVVYVRYGSAGEASAGLRDAVWGAEFRAGYEVVEIDGQFCLKITVPAGSSSFEFPVEILDSVNTRDNSRFELEIVKVEGNEARLMDQEFSQANPGLGDSVQTVIVDDTKPWLEAYNQKYTDGAGQEREAWVNSNAAGTLKHDADGGTLDGLIFKLTGSGAVWEHTDNTGIVSYYLTSQNQTTEQVDVTLKLELHGGMSLADFGPLNGPGCASLAELQTALNNANSDLTFSNIRYAENGTDILVDFSIAPGKNMAQINMPIFNDNLTEKDANGDPIESYTLSVHELEGSEARMDASGSAVTTTVRDDGQGPYLYVRCYDPDLISANKWVGDSTVISNPANPDYDDTSYVKFQVFSPQAAQEDMYADLVLCNTDRTPRSNVTEAEVQAILALNPGVTVSWANGNAGDAGAYPVFTVTVPEGQLETAFNIPKVPRVDAATPVYTLDSDGVTRLYPDDPGTPTCLYDAAGNRYELGDGTKTPVSEVMYKLADGTRLYQDPQNPALFYDGKGNSFSGAEVRLEYAGQKYGMSISNPVGGESNINAGANFAIVEVVQSSNPGPWTSIYLSNTDRIGQADPNATFYNNENGQLDGSDLANFRLHLAYNPQGSNHDRDADGKLDGDLTVVLKIHNVYGVTAADFDMDKFMTANAGLGISSASLDPDSMQLTIVFAEGTQVGQPGHIDTHYLNFKLPIKDDGVTEGREQYQIYLVSSKIDTATHQGIGVSTAPVDMGITEDGAMEVIWLEHAPSGFPGDDAMVIEGGVKNFYLVSASKPTGNFTVTFKYGAGGDSANSDSDYNPLPVSVSSSNGSGWEQINGKWVFKFSVEIANDASSEPDETFTLSIGKITYTGSVEVKKHADDAKNTVETVIRDDGLSGPLVYFVESGQTVAEEAGSLSFEVHLSKQATETVTVYLRVSDIEARMSPDGGYGTPDNSYDYTLQSTPGYLSPSDSDNPFPGWHIIKVTFQGDSVIEKVTLKDALLNDPYTENDEKFKIEIVGVQGGEARIKDGSDDDHGGAGNKADEYTVTITDSLNGPSVSLSQAEEVLSEGSSTIYAGQSETYGPSYNTGNGGTAGPADHPAVNTYTVSLGLDEHNQPIKAEEDITVILRVERVRGGLEGIFDGHGLVGNNTDDGVIEIGADYLLVRVTIKADENSADWVLDTLVNDKYVEEESRFTVSIESLSGNEAVKGDVSSVTTTVQDDDRAPEYREDKIIIMVPTERSDGVHSEAVINGLASGRDKDLDGDALSTLAGDRKTAFGGYEADELGNITYTLDLEAQSIKDLNPGGKLVEHNFAYTVTDGYNETASKVGLEVHATYSYEGSANAEWIFGTGGNDSIKGGGGKDVIRAGLGDDVLYDAGDGLGRLYGEEGDDTFIIAGKSGLIKAADFSRLDGGEGLDRLRAESDGLVFDFTGSEAAKNLNSVELIDISVDKLISGDSRINLDAAGVKALMDQMGVGDTGDGIPRVYGQPGNRFSFPEGENWEAVADNSLPGYSLYVNDSGSGSSKIWISNNMALVVDKSTLPAGDLDFSGNPLGGTGNYAIYSDSASGGGDTLKGGGGNDLLYGGDGNDTLDGGGGGMDQLRGGAGHDTLILHDSSGDGYITGDDFLLASGGSGLDTARLAHDGQSVLTDVDGQAIGVILDFNQISDASLYGVETIDLAGGNGLRNGVILDENSFVFLADSLDSNAQAQLRITGSPGDTYELCGNARGQAGEWAYLRTETGVDGKDWYVYEAGGKELWVDTTLTRKIYGTDGDDAIGGGVENSILIQAGAGNDVVNGGSGNEIIYGGDGNDSLRGGGGTDVIYAGAGDDIVYNDAATDSLYGEAGNDTFIMRDVDSSNGAGRIDGRDFGVIAGGKGLDALKLEESGQTLDLRSTATASGQISGIETINVNGNGANHVILDEAMLEHLTAGLDLDEQEQLRISGGSDDTYELAGDGWAYLDRVNNNGGSQANGPWLVYCNQNNDLLWVSAAMKRVYSGSAATDDAFMLDDLSGDKIISAQDFGRIIDSDSNDIDSIVLAGGGLTVDLTGIAPGQIQGVEIIDITDPQGLKANHIRLSGVMLENMGNTELIVDGRAGDTFEFTDSWTYVESSATYHKFTNSAGKTLYLDTDLKLVYNGDNTDNTFVLVDIKNDGIISLDDFAGIHGRGGTGDTIALPGGVTLDLTGLSAGIIDGIETIALGDQGNTLVLDESSLGKLGLTPATPLRVTGGGDYFDLRGDGWTMIGKSGDGACHQYRDASGRLVEIQAGIGRVLTGSDGADNSFTLYDVSGSDGVVNGSDFVSITGGTGTDTLKAGSNGLVFDFSGNTAGWINGIEAIDFGGTENNKLILDDNSLRQMGLAAGDFLDVRGNSGSCFELRGNWIFVSQNNNTLTYKDADDAEARLVQFTNMKRIYQGSDGLDDTFVLDNINGDTFINSLDFAAIRGGGGTDTIALNGGGLRLDLQGLAEGLISGVEVVNLGGNANRLILDADSLKAMGLSDGEILKVNGGATDVVELNGDWKLEADYITNNGYYRFALTDGGGETRYVDIHQDVPRGYQGTTGEDIFILEDISGDGKISTADFATIHGGDQNDTITLGGNNLDLDLRNLGDNIITSIEAMDLRGGGANRLFIDADSLTKLGARLNVMGDADDSYSLGEGFSYQRNESGCNVFRNANGSEIYVSQTMQRIYESAADGAAFALDDLDGDGQISGSDFASISSGGSGGSLTLGPNLANSGKTVNLTDLSAGQISGIAAIDTSGAGSNELILDASTFAGLGQNHLSVTGDAADTLTLNGNWSYDGTKYSLGANSLSVGGGLQVNVVMDGAGEIAAGPNVGSVTGSDQADIIHAGAGNDTIRGGAGNDTIYLGGGLDALYGGGDDDTFIIGYGVSGQIFNKGSFAVIDGEDGNDTLKLVGSGNTLDLQELESGRVLNIERIELGEDNTLILDAGIFSSLGDNNLSVDGRPGALLQLNGNWSYDGAAYSLEGKSISVGDDLLVHIVMGEPGSVMAGPQGGSITGTSGNDTISGGSGSDIIHAGTGSNILSGGGGSDVFAWSADDVSAGSDNQIQDFTVGEDLLFIEGLFDNPGSDNLGILEDLLSGGGLSLAQSGANGASLAYGDLTIDITFTSAQDVETEKAAFLLQLLQTI